MPPRVRRLMDSLKQSGRFVLPDAMLAAIREEFDAGRADEDRDRRPRSAPPGARPAIWSIPIPRWRWRSPTATPPRCTMPNIVLSTAHPAKFPDAVEAACGVRPQLPAWLDGPDDQTRTDQGDEERSKPRSSSFVLSVSRAAKQGVAG